MKLALAQINPTVGDLDGNTRKIIDYINKAEKERADIVVFPELAITGYPPEDLLLKDQFVMDNLSCFTKIKQASDKIAVYIGFVDKKGKDLFNAAAFIVDCEVKKLYHKINLPNYSVFDEKRYFKDGKNYSIGNYKGQGIGLGICEDIWVKDSPYLEASKAGASIMLNINASPYHLGKIKEREKILGKLAKKTKAYIVYLNMVGGQDELVFDGGSMVFGPKGEKVASAIQYKEELLFVDLGQKNKTAPWLDRSSEIYNALILGTSDYVKKNDFSDVLIGLSGGIDSALTLVIACDALGKDKVHPVFMPSQYTANQSYKDARKLCENLGIEMIEISIKDLFNVYLKELAPHFKGMVQNIAEENLQARIRGNYLMALSNKFGWLVLTTGNKSEMSTGYCTLYGDMSGGFSVLKDISKTLVYELSNFRNSAWKEKGLIPQSIIDRPPTAELKPDQKDQDTLPPYDILDKIMHSYVEENKCGWEVCKIHGIDKKIVDKIVKMIDFSEYKRRQTPPGPRITPRAFGKDWRLPITNRYFR